MLYHYGRVLRKREILSSVYCVKTKSMMGLQETLKKDKNLYQSMEMSIFLRGRIVS